MLVGGLWRKKNILKNILGMTNSFWNYELKIKISLFSYSLEISEVTNLLFVYYNWWDEN